MTGSRGLGFACEDDEWSPAPAIGLGDALSDESRCFAELRKHVGAALPGAVATRAHTWIERLRAHRQGGSPFDALLDEYALSSDEGLVLLALAEALLRIPDDATADRLLAERLAAGNWSKHAGRSGDWLVNASTWGLILGARVLRPVVRAGEVGADAMDVVLRRLGAPMVQHAVRRAMRLMGEHFIVGRDIDAALRRAAHGHAPHSFDMLGEAALTAADAERYLRAYAQAIDAIAERRGPDTPRHSVSVKLSALHPRYGPWQRDRMRRELMPAILGLAEQACVRDVALTIDAEECERLEISLELFAMLCRAPSLRGWDGLGLAVQAYQKRALNVIDFVSDCAHDSARRIRVRLVKGAYWDSEIKRAQQLGLDGFPVWTRRAHTDLGYLACARCLLASPARFYPMFATHNAHTIAAVSALAEATGQRPDYEFQRLHGMGEPLYALLADELDVPCRVYAPVGQHAQLLPYLVRRLLENGANGSFVHLLRDARVDPETLVRDPLADLTVADDEPVVRLPADLYAPQRRQSRGLWLSDAQTRQALAQALAAVEAPPPACSRSPVELRHEAEQTIRDPADRKRVIGSWRPLAPVSLAAMAQAGHEAQPGWERRDVAERAAVLRAAAERLEAEPAPWLALLIREAGKTVPDAQAEWRECVDLFRYYAQQAESLMAAPRRLPGPTGEHNELQWHARGVWACIAPWNFPLAIFGGQLAAALVTGNAVIAKPAEQTPLIGDALVRLLHEIGVPAAVLQSALGDGAIGAALCAQEAIAGVAFTGSLAAARAIQRTLAARDGPLVPLIAETGGLNAMLVDSTALPEQVVRDVIDSAFLSAGQRCSALRVLFLQAEIAEPILTMLRGAMAELRVGDPALFSSDLGPLIDDEARTRIEAHVARLRREAREIAIAPLAPELAARGHFVAPSAFEVENLAQIGGEQFGPVLHVIRYDARRLDAVLDEIDASGYGLTLGVQTRIEQTWREVQTRLRVGNCYVNRGMTGAVVGSQPFGGEGLSGTGPKAGGPHYLPRFMIERSVCVNTAAIGGNPELLAPRR